MKNLFFLFLFFYGALINLSAQDIVFIFNSKNSSNSIDSIKAIKIKTGETVFVEGSNIINMSSFTTGTKSIPSNPEEISVYPNPFENYTKLKFHSNQNENIKITLINAAGQIVAEKSQKITTGIYQFDISINNNGLYILNITGDQTKFSQKIISSRNSQVLNKIENNGYSSISPIEKSTKIEGAELIHFYVYSGDNITKIADSLTVSKTYEVEFHECKDADGKSYPIIQIGEQWWMAENLEYLPNVGPYSSSSVDEPRYYVYRYEGNKVADAKQHVNYTSYGVLYNWYAALIAGPIGWHLPTDDEWKQLENTIGNMSQDKLDDSGWRGINEGTKLKATSGWVINYNGTDVYGFSALPGGSRDEYGGSPVGEYGGWWSSTETDIEPNLAETRTLNWINGGIYRGSGNKGDGFSVRCIKD